jgi:Ca2+-binding RTX toxin-like protein
LSYRAFDGPMDGATAYIDTNNNGFFDPSDWYTYTDNDGFFSIDFVDADRDGSWDASEAIKRPDGRTFLLDPTETFQIKVIGGTDTVSASLNRHELITSLSTTGGVVSPMTTLIEGLVGDLGLDPEAAELAVVKILGLDPSIDLATFDPFSVSVSGQVSEDYRVKASQLYNLGYITDVVAADESYNGLSSLGRNLLQAATRTDGSLVSLNLASTDDLTTFFKGLAAIEVSAGALDAFTSIANRGNLQIADSGAAADVLSVLNSDRSLDGLSRTKLSDSSFDSSRDLMHETLRADYTFEEGGAAAFIWDERRLGVPSPDEDLLFEAMQTFIGLPEGPDAKQHYTHLPGADIQARHNGETNAYAEGDNATVITDERVTLIKDSTLDYSMQSAEHAATKPILLEATNTHSVNLSAPGAHVSADLVHQTRVLDRSSLELGKGDDILAVNAETDVTISMFESLDGDLDLDISSIAMNLSQLDAGEGDDVVTLSGDVRLQIQAPDDLADLIADFEPEQLGMVDSILSGGKGNDHLVVQGAVRSRINGGADDDDLYLIGESEQVVLDGGSGNDRLFGSHHAESMVGGEGDDLLLGNGGADIMEGGAGSDIFVLDMDMGVDIGILSEMSDFEKALISGMTDLDLARITDFNAMEGDAIALRGQGIGIAERAQDLFTYGASQADMDKQVLLLSYFNEFFFSGVVEHKEGFTLLQDTDMLLQVGADQQLTMLGYVSADVTPANGMVFTTDMSLQA